MHRPALLPAAALGAVLVLVPGRAGAVEDGEKVRPLQRSGVAELIAEALKRFDADGDGAIARAEWKGQAAFFDELDADRDQRVTKAELEARSALLVERLRRMAAERPLVPLRERFESLAAWPFDGDGNGVLSEKEFTAYVFAAADQDGDGAIREDEAQYLATWPPASPLYQGQSKRLLQRHDQDGDGAVRARELKLDGSVFKQHDRDRSGGLGPQELDPGPQLGFEAFANQNPDTILERFDADQDGALEGGELPGGARSAFQRADADKDGSISRDELSRVLAEARSQQFARLDADFLARFDLNGDGKVSAQEFPGGAAAFSRLDPNGDGVVDRKDAPRRP